MRENRVYPRIPIELKVTCQPKTVPPVAPVEGVSADLSRGGLLFKTNAYAVLQGTVSGEIKLPLAEQPLRFKANVVWRQTQGAVAKNGLQFTEIDSTDKDRLEAFIKSVWNQMLTVY